MQLALMEIFGCLGAETALKDVWKCAAEVSGVLSVEICGMTWMLKLCATSLGSQKQVSFHNWLLSSGIVFLFSSKSTHEGIHACMSNLLSNNTHTHNVYTIDEYFHFLYA